MLEEFLDTNKALFADDYLISKIDLTEMTNGAEVGEQLRGTRSGGIPWITILDGDGMELINSDGPHGNIGCPITEAECEFFVTMVEKTIRHAPDGRIQQIAQALEDFAQKRRR